MKEVFEANPDINFLFCFEDENCFVNETDAKNYARTSGLPYKEVTKESEIKQPKNKK